MAEKMLADAYQNLMNLYLKSENEQKYEEALRYAVAAYGIARDFEIKDELLSTVVFMHAACEEILILHAKKFTTRRSELKFACSFCGKTEPAVKLIPSGHEPVAVFICNECVSTFSEAFKKKP